MLAFVSAHIHPKKSEQLHERYFYNLRASSSCALHTLLFCPLDSRVILSRERVFKLSFLAFLQGRVLARFLQGLEQEQWKANLVHWPAAGINSGVDETMCGISRRLVLIFSATVLERKKMGKYFFCDFG